jgi:hypothetical protein
MHLVESSSVDGEMFYVNFFNEKKTHWEKPRDAFIKSLPETGHLQGDSKRQMGRDKYRVRVRGKEVNDENIRRWKRDGGDDSDRDLATVSSSQKREEPQFNPDQLLQFSCKRGNPHRHLPDLNQSGIIGETMLYRAVYRGFREIIGRISKPSNDRYESPDSVLSFKSWIESQLNWLIIWGQEVGVEEDALDYLKYRKADSDLHKALTTYLTGVYESLKVIEQNICEGLHNIRLVEEQ